MRRLPWCITHNRIVQRNDCCVFAASLYSFFRNADYISSQQLGTSYVNNRIQIINQTHGKMSARSDCRMGQGMSQGRTIRDKYARPPVDVRTDQYLHLRWIVGRGEREQMFLVEL